MKVCELGELRRHGDRVHVQLGDRHVSLINHRGEVYCLDSLCYHAGGPLGIGDIEDVGGRACLSCPWHLYKVTLESGEKLYGSTKLDETTGEYDNEDAPYTTLRLEVWDRDLLSRDDFIGEVSVQLLPLMDARTHYYELPLTDPEGKSGAEGGLKGTIRFELRYES